MSEEILKALTQLFAIITKQDGGTSENERAYVIKFFKSQLNPDVVPEYTSLYDKFAEYNKDPEKEDKPRKGKLTSVRDSVKTLAICRKINKTLTQKQKVVVLVQLFEMLHSDKSYTPQRMQIIDTVAEVFNIESDEFEMIQSFVIKEDITLLDYKSVLVIDGLEESRFESSRHIHQKNLEAEVLLMNVPSVELFFAKYTGDQDCLLNGFSMGQDKVKNFPPGSILKPPMGPSIYYSDVVAKFSTERHQENITFNVNDLEYKFPNGKIGLQNVNISETHGKLVGIMGASGAGKTTLLNCLAGIMKPSGGSVRLNGINLHEGGEDIKGLIGYVSQDDILFEDLTVYQNLFYNTKLCFAEKSDEEIDTLVIQTLKSFGLLAAKDIKVGNVLNKKISGGQRKRLNIALEVIREPSVLFVDEPTSGLSSRDSENVMDLLRQLALKGKLIFVVIHQPSSDIYRMFDKMYILDTGGFPVYYGHPIDSLEYFKKASNQIITSTDKASLQPEQIFNIIEAKIVDEYGQYTDSRKMTPAQWHQYYQEHNPVEHVEDETKEPEASLNPPGKLRQFAVFTIRDLLSKVSNVQYMIINLLEAPLLAFFLAFIIYYKNSPDGAEYIYRHNDNIPAYLLIAVIIALFMGMTVSAEEIIKDQKILKRERFLNLSRLSYIFSKVGILFTLSAIQTLTFILIGNLILDIEGMNLAHWLVLFSAAACANLIGLNISDAFNSAVTIYIVIPILLIPQLILSGAIFSYDKLNPMISDKGEVPFIANIMVSRWAFEAMAVEQFKSNDYQESIYEFEMIESQYNYISDFLIPEIEKRLNEFKLASDSSEAYKSKLWNVSSNSINSLKDKFPKIQFDAQALNQESLPTEAQLEKVYSLTDKIEKRARTIFLAASEKKEKILSNISILYPGADLETLKNQHYNESLADITKNLSAEKRVEENGKMLIQNIDHVFMRPNPKHALDFGSHFYAPEKHFGGKFYDTYAFNIAVIWVFTILLTITLYFSLLRKAINSFSKLSK